MSLGLLTSKEDQFYEQLFTQDSSWSQRYPNFDEAVRASEILPILALIAQRHSKNGNTHLRIIDVGCGRGWLTNILSIYGETVGLEPVAAVVTHASERYPHLQFLVGTPEEHAGAGNTGRYDVAVCSEVIEHVPYEKQLGFLKALASLVRSDGDIVLTTPRGEVYDSWKNTVQHPQPIEAWLTEDQLENLAARCGLIRVRRNRFFPASFGRTNKPVSHKRPFRRLFSAVGYIPDNTLDQMVYQILWLRNPTTLG